MIAYIPYMVFRLLTGAEVGIYLQTLTQSQWTLVHQLLCLLGGFLWLAATVSYARRSSEACVNCGHRWHGRVDESRRSRTLGSSGRVLVHGSASPLRFYSLCLGIGSSTWYERGVSA